VEEAERGKKESYYLIARVNKGKKTTAPL